MIAETEARLAFFAVECPTRCRDRSIAHLWRGLPGVAVATLRLALVCGVTAILQPHGTARADTPVDLSGDWVFDLSRGGDRTDRLGTIDVGQDGDGLRATWVKLSDSMRDDFGFTPGDVAFEGEIRERTLAGRMRLHYPVENRDACPDRWQTWERLEIAVPPDPTRLQGRFRNSAISARDCSTEDRGWLFFTLTRVSERGINVAAATGGILAESAFDSDDEGWTLVSPQGAGAAPAPYRDNGGNPGGYIAGPTDGTEAVWEAPIQFLGDRGAAQGGELLFDLRGSDGAPANQVRVVLEAADEEIVRELAAETVGPWETFSVRLTADDAWRVASTGDPADPDDLRQALSSLRRLRIAATAATGLDNVVLSGAGAAKEIAAERGEDKPARVSVDLIDRSAVVGKAMNLDVSLVNAANERVVADKDYRVDLTAEGAAIRPDRVDIPPGAAGATARVYGEAPGAIAIHGTATEAELAAGTATGFVCATGPIARIAFGADAQEAPLGESIHATLDLVSETGTLVSDDGRRKRLNVAIEGVGRSATPNAGWIEEGRCATEFDLISDRPGESPVAVSLGAIGPEARTFRFYLPLDAMALLAVALGGLLGGFARAASVWSKSRSWSLARWAVDLVAAVISGLAVFLVYRFGVIEALPRLSGGIGLVVLLALVGGYLGPTALDRIADRILPPAKGS
jgi:hypothetical protein